MRPPDAQALDTGAGPTPRRADHWHDSPAAEARVAHVHAWKAGRGEVEDALAVEQPLEIRIDGHAVAVTLRTPGEDHELVAGFAVTEGIVASAGDIARIVRVDDAPDEWRGNVVDLQLVHRRCDIAQPVARGNGGPRMVTAACGACGPGTLANLRRPAGPLPDGEPVAAGPISTLPDQLLAAQAVFAVTGGLHAAGLFDHEGRLIVAREDVGRHNAVDKVVGHGALRGETRRRDRTLFVSGRVGFEIVQKAWMAGIPVLASVSAPSDLAVRMAREANMALVGFVRGHSFTVYAGRHRLGLP
jgi:FdhD protein